MGVGPCERPGCDGAVEADGYCNVCGLAPVGGSKRVAADPVPGAPVVPPGVSVPTTSRGTSTIRRFATPTGTTSQPTGGATGSGGSRGNLGAGLVEMPAGPHPGSALGRADRPRGPRAQAVLRPLQRAGGPEPRGPPGRDRRVLPPLRWRLLLHAQALAGRPGGRPVPGGRVHRPRRLWAGSTWPRTRTSRTRWVVLKGLLDSGTSRPWRRPSPSSGSWPRSSTRTSSRSTTSSSTTDAGYIVMEYVGGESLRELRNRHREETGCAAAGRPGHRLRSRDPAGLRLPAPPGLLFCDFKPDNVIQTEEQLTLIDLGGVRPIGRPGQRPLRHRRLPGPRSPRSGAPASPRTSTPWPGPWPSSASTSPGFQDEKRYAISLPPVQDVPEFARYESFHRFLLKATAADPDPRFQSAARDGRAADRRPPPGRGRRRWQPAPGPERRSSARELGPRPTSARGRPPGAGGGPRDPAAGVLATLALVGVRPARRPSWRRPGPPS